MGSATGQEIKAAFKKAVAWGTAVAAGALDGVLIRAGGGHTLTMPNNVDDSLGVGWPTSADPGEVSAGGEFNAYLRYDSLDLLLAMAMGSGVVDYGTPKVTGTADATGTTTSITDAGAFTTVAAGDYLRIAQGAVVSVRKVTARTDNSATWVGALATATDIGHTWKVHDPALADATHVYDLAENTDGQFITSALYNKVNVDELPSAKVTGFTIKGQVGQPVEFIFKLQGIERVFNSAVNTLASFANVTFREAKNRVLFSHSVFRLNDQDGVALASPTHMIYPSSFELTFDRKMAGVYGQGGSFDKTDEPTVDGIPTVSLKLEFPRYVDATHFANWEARNKYQKLDLVFTGTSGRAITIQCPNMQYANVDLPVIEGTLKQPVEFNLLSCVTAPTGMTNVTKPFRITMVNTFGGNPLEAGN